VIIFQIHNLNKLFFL